MKIKKQLRMWTELSKQMLKSKKKKKNLWNIESK